MTDRENTPETNLTPDEQEVLDEAKDNFFPESVEEVLPQAEPSDGQGQLP